MIDGLTPQLDFNSGSVSGQRYRDEFLELYVRLFRDAYKSDFLFINDNARPYRLNLADEVLEREHIERISWSTKCPDLNPIENLWDFLGRVIERKQSSS